jgi:hypothetical protein
MRASWTSIVALLLAGACDEPTAGPASMCVAAEGRVVAAVDGELSAITSPTLAGDALVFGVGEAVLTAYHVDECGAGTRVRIAGPELELTTVFALATAAGPLAVGHAHATGLVLVLDRLAVAGVDAPREVARLDVAGPAGWHRWDGGMLLWDGPLGTDAAAPLAGDGQPTSALLWFPAADGGPAARLTDDAVWLAAVEGTPGRFVALTDAGALLEISDGAAEVLQTGVRRVSLAGDGAQLVWQELGDGERERVFLRDLARGEDLPLGWNEFAALGWARGVSPTPRFLPGSWVWTDEAVGLVGPAGTLVRAFARADGARLRRPPPHVAVDGEVRRGGERFFLTAQRESTRVEVAWDPRSGAADEWLRAPAQAGRVLRPERVRDGVRYYEGDPQGGRLWLRRFGAAAPELLQPAYSLDLRELPDGRTVVAVPDAAPGTSRLLVLEVDGGREVLATGVSRWSAHGDRVVYAVTTGEDAGIWTVTP